MNTSTQKFSAEEISALQSLIGQEFRFVGGAKVPSYLVSDYFLIGCSESAISILGDSDFVSLKEDSGDYSFMRIHMSKQEESESALKSGNVYLLNRRSKILGVSVVTETISRKDMESSQWNYVVDIALVIRLELGFLVIQLVSHNAEAISVEYTDDFSLERLDVTSSSFESDLVTSYQSELTVAQLG